MTASFQSPPSPASATRDRIARIALPLVLLAAALFAYWPALQAGYVWDDDAHLTAPALRTWAGLGRIWSEPGATQQYYPLLHSLFWLEHRLWGDAPLGYHAVNLLLHTGAAWLFVAVLRQLQVRGAWFAALLFALHPVQVETVAWVSEQKNTLSALLGLAAALAYLRFHGNRLRRTYLLATALFVLGLLAKSVIATVPAGLLVVLWWREGRLRWREDVAPLAPWMLLGTMAGLFTAWTERSMIGATGDAFALSWADRLVLCGRVVWFYAAKLLWPENLTFIYPRWTLAPREIASWVPLGAALFVVVALWALRRRTRAPLAVALLFGGMLFPVLGFLNVYPFRYSFVADHFQYLATLAPLAAAGAMLDIARERHRMYGLMAVAALLFALGVASHAQSRLYRDNPTLMHATTVRNPTCWMAFNNLGKEFMSDPSRRGTAIALFERALALYPDYPEAENNLGLTLTQSGRPLEALPHLVRARRLDPLSYQAANNLGIALATSGRAEEALRAFAQAAMLNPRLANIQENWAKALLLLGRKEEAAIHFAKAAELRPAIGPKR